MGCGEHRRAMSELERIIRPIVEGQIRGFLKEHPKVVDAVNWYRKRDDKAQTFINSLSKRIVRDLTCSRTTARLAAALLEPGTEAQPDVVRGIVACGDDGARGMATARPGLSAEAQE